MLTLLDTMRTFQFTHPGRGATHHSIVHHGANHCFNSRTPGGVRQIDSLIELTEATSFNSRTPGGVRLDPAYMPQGLSDVSIHAPREGCDSAFVVVTLVEISFNSRTPGGVRRLPCVPFRSHTYVSIHAPREGCD